MSNEEVNIPEPPALIKDNSFNLLDRVIEYRILTHKDLTNDYYFIQYLGTVLDYIEREHKGCLTQKGKMSLAVDVSPIYRKFLNKEVVSQKELVKFCLYMTNAYAVCVLFKGMIEVYKETNDKFVELHKELPTYVFGDMIEFDERVFKLTEDFKKIMDTFSKLLEGKYRTTYNDEKHNGFAKQIFSTQVVRIGNSMPSDLMNAKECR